MGESEEALRLRFGRRLRELRKAHRLTQEDLAGRANVAPKYLGAVERGEVNISLDRVARLADVLEVPAADLLEERAGRRDETLEGFLRRAKVLMRRAGGGKRRLMMQLLEDVAGLYGKERRPE